MKAFFLLSFLLCGAVASATDYSYRVNLSGNGGAYAVGVGENKVVAQDCSYDNLYAAGENVGGAIYVGANANLELQGNHTFSNNAQWAWEEGMGIWYGFYNDIYLADGATLTLNAQAADLLSGVGKEFSIILEGVSLEENGVTSSVTMTGYTMEAGGVKIEMRGESDATVPEPTTARRRRSA